MQVEFRVMMQAGAWCVLRGSTAPLRFLSQDAAMKAATGMAKAMAARGERGVVRLQRDDKTEKLLTFEPDRFPKRSAVTFDPEADFARRSLLVRAASDHRNLFSREP